MTISHTGLFRTNWPYNLRKQILAHSNILINYCNIKNRAYLISSFPTIPLFPLQKWRTHRTEAWQEAPGTVRRQLLWEQGEEAEAEARVGSDWHEILPVDTRDEPRQTTGVLSEVCWRQRAVRWRHLHRWMFSPHGKARQALLPSQVGAAEAERTSQASLQSTHLGRYLEKRTH